MKKFGHLLIKPIGYFAFSCLPAKVETVSRKRKQDGAGSVGGLTERIFSESFFVTTE
jgi:hypothetical protein